MTGFLFFDIQINFLSKLHLSERNVFEHCKIIAIIIVIIYNLKISIERHKKWQSNNFLLEQTDIRKEFRIFRRFNFLAWIKNQFVLGAMHFRAIQNRYCHEGYPRRGLKSPRHLLPLRGYL